MRKKKERKTERKKEKVGVDNLREIKHWQKNKMWESDKNVKNKKKKVKQTWVEEKKCRKIKIKLTWRKERKKKGKQITKHKMDDKTKIFLLEEEEEEEEEV